MADDTDGLGVGSYFFLATIILPNTLLLVNTSYRMYKEFIEDYFDFFRITQYLFLLVYLIAWGIFYIAIIANFKTQYPLEISVWIASATNMGYIMINILLWVLIIVHISNLMTSVQGKEFSEVVKRIKLMEIGSILIFIAIFLAISGFNGWSAFEAFKPFNTKATSEDIILNESPKILKDDEWHHDIDKVGNIIALVLYAIFIFTELGLIIKLMKLVNKYGDFDKNYTKYFKYLAASNILYYIFQITTYSLMNHHHQTYGDFSKFLRSKESNAGDYIIFFFNQNLPLAYAYLNINNVSFRNYVRVLLWGVGKPNFCLADYSFFIILSCKARDPENSVAQIDAENDSTSEFSSEMDHLMSDNHRITNFEDLLHEHDRSSRGLDIRTSL